MAGNLLGRLDWERTVDDDGHRNYTLKWLVLVDDPEDGPVVVGLTPGLPLVGSPWLFGNDFDLDATLWSTERIEPVLTKEPNTLWTVEQFFTTKPRFICTDAGVGNPLLEPDRLSGSFVRYSDEKSQDRFGKPIKNSAHEDIKGPQVEYDANRPTVTIGRNVAFLPIEDFAPAVDTVNKFFMWGLGPRKIKLSNVSWQKAHFGTCFAYFIVDYTFDVRFDTFDKPIADKGTMCLIEDIDGNPAGNPANLKDFIQCKDIPGENISGNTWLNGKGSRLQDSENLVFFTPQIYNETDFVSVLGIPDTLT